MRLARMADTGHHYHPDGSLRTITPMPTADTTDQLIPCPQCGHAIPITDALTKEIERRTKEKWEQEFRRQEAELARRTGELAQREKAIESAQRQITERVEERVRARETERRGNRWKLFMMFSHFLCGRHRIIVQCSQANQGRCAAAQGCASAGRSRAGNPLSTADLAPGAGDGVPKNKGSLQTLPKILR